MADELVRELDEQEQKSGNEMVRLGVSLVTIIIIIIMVCIICENLFRLGKCELQVFLHRLRPFFFVIVFLAN